MCGNCGAYVKGQQLQQGECRRMPPTLMVFPVGGGQAGAGTAFPQVRADMWCLRYIDPDVLARRRARLQELGNG